MSIKGYYTSSKDGSSHHYNSSYELRAFVLLDSNPVVQRYTTQVAIEVEGRKRFIDLLVQQKDCTKLVEVKPECRVTEFEHQIADFKKHAIQNGWKFEIWTEESLGFIKPEHLTEWAICFIRDDLGGPDHSVARLERRDAKMRRHYVKNVQSDTVEVYCDFCGENHTALRLTYEKNLARNGQYICERHGGYIIGSRPKPHFQKHNPFAAEGKKKCNHCKDVLPLTLEYFGIDKSRKDGYATWCRKCRATRAKLKYHSEVNNGPTH